MAIVGLKKRFGASPDKETIVSLIGGDNVGNKGKAKEALINLLAPMKDLLALYEFVNNLDLAAQDYVDLLKERDTFKTNLASLKTQMTNAQKAYDEAVDQQKLLAMGIAALEKEKEALSKEIEDEETAKLRINKVVSDEYDRLRSEMLVRVAAEEKEARQTLLFIGAEITAAQAKLEDLAEKKRQFIASLGG